LVFESAVLEEQRYGMKYFWIHAHFVLGRGAGVV